MNIALLLSLAISCSTVDPKSLNSPGAYDNVETIVIGDLEWMVEDLSVTHFRNGDPIIDMNEGEYNYQLYEIDEPAFMGSCFNNLAINDSRGLIPEGWRIPSLEDWNQLIDAFKNGKHQHIEIDKLQSCFPLSSITVPTNNYENHVNLFALPNYWTSSFDVEDWSERNRKYQATKDKEGLQRNWDTTRYFKSIWLWTKNENYDSITTANGTIQYPCKYVKCVRDVVVEGLHLSLKASNTGESASSRIETEADQTIRLMDGTTCISTFADYGSGYLSDEKDFISIFTDAGSERTYTLVSNSDETVTITQHFIMFGEENETWSRTYQRESPDRWVLKNCEGDCN